MTGSGIYRITCRANGKFYIGSAVSISKRWNEHRRTLSNGAHKNPRLQAAWVKYGECEFAFEVLEACAKDQLLVVEQRWLDSEEAVKLGFNLNPVAGSNLGRRWSDEVRARMSAGKQAMPDHIKQKLAAGLAERNKVPRVRAPEHNLKISLAQRGRQISPESIAKMAAAKRTISDATRAEIVALRATGMSYERIAKAVGVSVMACWEIINGARKRIRTPRWQAEERAAA